MVQRVVRLELKILVGESLFFLYIIQSMVLPSGFLIKKGVQESLNQCRFISRSFVFFREKTATFYHRVKVVQNEYVHRSEWPCYNASCHDHDDKSRETLDETPKLSVAGATSMRYEEVMASVVESEGHDGRSSSVWQM